jgi:hypothetical protein
MQMLADGAPLGAALERMAATHADFDFSQWLVGALQLGWLQGATADLPHDPSLQEATS